MKKRTVRLLSLLMAATFLATSTMTTEAAATGAHRKLSDLAEEEKTDFKEENYVEGQAIVLYKNNKIETKSAARRALRVGDISVKKIWNFDDQEVSGNVSAQSARTVSDDASMTVALVESKSLSTEKLVDKLSADKNVEIAEPNYRVHAFSNDPYFSKQWGLKNRGQNGGVEGNSTNVEKKWEKTKGSKDVVVAIVDTGVDYTHEDLKSNMWENAYQPQLRGEYGFDFANGDTDPMDGNGHGTHCAGIIGAKGDNGIGVSGINQDVKIMALKALDDEGGGEESAMIDSYNYINKALNLGVNVVAINNSWGGPERSDILKKLIDLVGRKGAVSVCAAGNGSADKDSVASYPANYDSPYVVSVAATNEMGQLSKFSNYGKEMVDIAAPGSDILSTYAFNRYNPSLYSDEKQKELTQKFENFNGESTWSEWSPENIKFESTMSGKEANYKAELCDDNFGESKGKALKLSMNGVTAGEAVRVKIPYTVSEGTKDFPNASIMVKASGPKASGMAMSGTNMFLFGECGKEQDLPESVLDIMDETIKFDGDYDGFVISGEMEDWMHMDIARKEGNTKTGDRYIFLEIMALKSGNYSIVVDDAGLSKENVKSSQFGKYEFDTGTSMATPFVTGAIALEAAENAKSTAQDRILAVLSQVKRTDALKGKVASDGALDYTQKVATAPRISSVKLNQTNGQITIKGSGLDASDLAVKVTKKGNRTGKNATIIKKTAKQVVIDGKAWKNRVVTIAVTGNGRTATKRDIYLVDGKMSYKKAKGLEVSSSGAMATNGKDIYIADSLLDRIQVLDQTDPKESDEYRLCKVKATDYFKKDKGGQVTYDFSFGKDLVYADGMLYNIGAYSEVSYADDEDDDEDPDDFDFGGLGESTKTAYSSQYKFFSFNISNGKVKCIGSLPSAVKHAEDWTLASYNGKIYLIGGYDHQKKACSRKVYIYNPTKKKWSQGPSLPEGRAGGRAVQSGGKLVYTLGYGSNQDGVEYDKQACPVNLVLNGNKWTASKKTLKTYGLPTKVVNGSKTYKKFDASVSICGSGLVYVGTPMEGLGDTFVYNVAKDVFYATKYNQIKDLSVYTVTDDEEEDEWETEDPEKFNGIAVGKTLYIFDEEGQGYKVPVSSALVKVKAKAYKGGRIYGANKAVIPGNKVQLVAKANKGYKLKSFKVAGKKVKGSSITIRLTSNKNASASFVKKK
ncbi:MAG: S8 family serine peptidase [Lachnospiraceae bacterium]|nr:S8 family serine peptidase [Lachnospiraceae bacterium]